ncbi:MULTISPECIES: hypothetical protein [unclassified Streptomyces]|uniref:hypothetical protein n=1 Tax=unclassified Streptomyces TaxID=2593676 RepID=UPI0006F89E7F|nr:MULTISPECIES: hypothetical protein [unclassified Streptomyces]KQX52105.1 hypothetical protein ASD33_33335 [Streptomyces sp. Root1304]KRA86252.1 hypothetical protein ASE09_33315 [Streptomyces sp. Root66D1]
METLIALAAVAVLIALGMRLIHRLNSQHDARIAAHHFSDPFPAIFRPPGHGPRTPKEQGTRRRPTGTWP